MKLRRGVLFAALILSAVVAWYSVRILGKNPAALFFASLARHFIRRKEKEFYLAAFSSTGL